MDRTLAQILQYLYDKTLEAQRYKELSEALAEKNKILKKELDGKAYRQDKQRNTGSEAKEVISAELE